MTELAAILLLLFVIACFDLGRRRALSCSGGAAPGRLHSRPVYHGQFVALCTGLPALALFVLWLLIVPGFVEGRVLDAAKPETLALPEERLEAFLGDARTLAEGGTLFRDVTPVLRDAAAEVQRAQAQSERALAFLLALAVLGGFAFSYRRIHEGFRARSRVERMYLAMIATCSAVAVLVTLGIVFSLAAEAYRFFLKVPLAEFLFGLHWSPQTAIRADQVGSSGAFGAVPVFAGTALITLIAMLVAAPVGLFSAIYLSEYAGARVHAFVKPGLEILAGIPTVVYGFFAALTVAPLVRGFGESLGLDVASESALAAGAVMGVMIIPFVSSLSDDVIRAVPRSLREGSLGLGATPSETIRRVVLPAALPGIVGALLLAVSRAIGETMIVVMAAGLAARLTANPLDAVTTVTVQIVTLLTGDQEFDSAKTLAAFALGISLFFVTLALNVLALNIVRRYREQYE